MGFDNENCWKNVILFESDSIRDAISNLDKYSLRIVLVVNDNNKLIGTLSDGDIRRGILNNIDLNSQISKIMNVHPMTAMEGLNKKIIHKMMIDSNVQQIPIINDDHEIVGLHLWNQFNENKKISNTLVVMAGGFGSRLLPHTKNCPKPMVKIAGKPILEHIVLKAKSEGILNFIFIVHHLGNQIQDYFSDGNSFGISIEYIYEKIPLGTAGGISLIKKLPKEPLIVTNGDVISDINYSEILDFHISHNAMATMAVKRYQMSNPFGVVRIDGIEINGFDEKPITESYINAGIYILDPKVLGYLKKEERCDMPKLFERLDGNNLIAFPIHESWQDVGTVDDFKLLNKKGRINEF